MPSLALWKDMHRSFDLHVTSFSTQLNMLYAKVFDIGAATASKQVCHKESKFRFLTTAVGLTKMYSCDSTGPVMMPGVSIGV